DKVRAALAHDMFGLKAHQFFQSMETPDDRWQSLWHNFHEAHQIWIRQGVNPMLHTLMVRRKVKARLLSLPDGERRITNVRHLIELLHNAESQHGFNPEGLLKWLAFQMQSGQESDEQQLRLESDARAVRIITMHKSKGLQFDVVFCPFIWGGVRLDKDAAVFHDNRHNDRLTLTLGPQIPLEQRMQAQREQLAENLRMLYVALTRAKERCYMVWGRINGSEVSAPAYLFHGTSLTLSDSDGFNSLTQKMKSITDARMIHDLKLMAERSEGTIKIEALPQGTGEKLRPEDKHEVAGSNRVLQRRIGERWRMASFSSLTAGVEKDAHAWPDRDLYTSREKVPASVSGKFDTLFDFPRGANAGLFFHDLLEHWDHTRATPSRQDVLIQSKLRFHGFDSRWDSVISRLLLHLSKKELKTSKASFSLSQVDREHRVNEMEFYFPLKRITARDMQQCFVDFAGQRTAGAMDRQLGRLTFAPMQGFMKGYIDTVFHYRQQYYLVDWKSNYLGSRLEDYRPEQLAATMLDDFYFLQYHLYTVAVHRLLHQKINGFQYDRDFGGVFYFFLRGVTGAASDSAGVYFDKPDHALVSALDHLLIANQKR
ncbi:MAG: 3'-5' exonuclease, partial [Desulfobacteraceae bacterium]